MKTFLAAISLVLLSLPTHALYLIDTPQDPIKPEEIAGENKDYPNVAKITAGTLSGTGTLISPKVVLTAGHVVSSTNYEGRTLHSPLPSDSVKVNFGDTAYKVAEIILPELEYLDIALLVLTEKVDNINPRRIRTVDEEDLITKITIMGYGQGRAIYPEDNEKIDENLYKTIKDVKKLTSKFRFRKDIPVNLQPNKDRTILRIHEKVLFAKLKNDFADRMQKTGAAWQQDPTSVEKRAAFEAVKTQYNLVRELSEDEYFSGERALNVLLSITTRSGTFFTGQGDSGGPLLDERGHIIGVLSLGSEDLSIIQQASDQEALNLVVDPKRLMKFLGGTTCAYAVCAVPVAYAASAYLDTSLMLSTGIGSIAAWVLNAAAKKTLGNAAPMNYLEHKYYAKPYAEIVKKSDEAIVAKAKEKGFMEGSYIAITDDIKDWIDDVVDATT